MTPIPAMAHPRGIPTLRTVLIALIGGALIGGVGLALVVRTAHAQDRELSIEVVGEAGWAETVAALQHDASAQGAHLSVRVVDATAHRAPCGFYALTFDEPGARAFTIGTCDPATDATDVVLVSRTDLFSHEGVVPRPRAIRLAAK